MQSLLVRCEMDNPRDVARSTKIYEGLLREEMDGPDACTVLTSLHAALGLQLHGISRQFTDLLKDSELELELIAGEIKYLVADLRILEVCAELAGTTDGRCRLIGAECAARLRAKTEALRMTLGLSQPRQAA
jgi:hypothetical protein